MTALMSMKLCDTGRQGKTGVLLRPRWLRPVPACSSLSCGFLLPCSLLLWCSVFGSASRLHKIGAGELETCHPIVEFCRQAKTCYDAYPTLKPQASTVMALTGTVG